MSESKHSFTPGPWELRYTDSYEYKIYAGSIVSGDFARIATASDLFDDNGEANAFLIAASPELLSLARDYRGVIEFAIRSDIKRGDVEGANMKRLTLQYVESILAKTSPPTREEGVRGND
jgi:hypothetical protein